MSVECYIPQAVADQDIIFDSKNASETEKKQVSSETMHSVREKKGYESIR